MIATWTAQRPDRVANKLLAEWFWTDRWIGSSAFLLPLEPRGLYREMLTAAWRRGARLPADPITIQRAVACTTSEWERCWPEIRGYWREEGDGLWIMNETQVEIFTETQAITERAANRGRRGAEARWAGKPELIHDQKRK